jgi:hypothetical protein
MLLDLNLWLSSCYCQLKKTFEKTVCSRLQWTIDRCFHLCLPHMYIVLPPHCCLHLCTCELTQFELTFTNRCAMAVIPPRCWSTTPRLQRTRIKVIKVTFAIELADERVHVLTRVAAFDCFVWLLATQLVWLLQRRGHGLGLLRSMLQSPQV